MPELPLIQLDCLSWLFQQLAMAFMPQLYHFNSKYLLWKNMNG